MFALEAATLVAFGHGEQNVADALGGG